MGRAFVLVLMLGVATAAAGSAACAEEPSAPSVPEDLKYTPQWPAPPDTGALLMRLGLGTTVVLVLCVGSLYAARPWLQKLHGQRPGTAALQIEGSIALGNRAVLYLVKIGDTQLVAGTDAAGLKSLITLPASFKDALESQLTDAVGDPPHATLPLSAVAGS